MDRKKTEQKLLFETTKQQQIFSFPIISFWSRNVFVWRILVAERKRENWKKKTIPLKKIPKKSFQIISTETTTTKKIDRMDAVLFFPIFNWIFSTWCLVCKNAFDNNHTNHSLSLSLAVDVFYHFSISFSFHFQFDVTKKKFFRLFSVCAFIVSIVIIIIIEYNYDRIVKV